MIDIQENVPLSSMTSFKIGGPAKYFSQVSTEEDLKEALEFANKNSLNFFVLGNGTNVLVSDKGFDGLVIKTNFSKVETLNDTIVAEAGVLFSAVVRKSAENGLSGLEWAASVPGSLGGAVVINAGCFGGEIKNAVESVKFFDIAKLEANIYSAIDCKFSYRSSIFKELKDKIIISATLKLNKDEIVNINERIKEIIKKRVAQQPQGLSAGSFFKKALVNDENLLKKFYGDGGAKFEDNKISAGWLIEEAGLKGKKIGGAMVSEKHANFILNTGNATAEDVIMLVSLIKQQVRDQFGVELEEEVSYVGF
jgi:UDP-N-acetylmuramate dehydrogenase